MLFVTDVDILRDLAQSGGIVLFLLLAIWGLRKKWWVPGWYYQKAEEEAEEWKRLALRTTNLAEYLTEIKKKDQ